MAKTQKRMDVCPVCAKPLVMCRYGKSYWQVMCETPHWLANTKGCPMKTQAEAWLAWDIEQKQSK